MSILGIEGNSLNMAPVLFGWGTSVLAVSATVNTAGLAGQTSTVYTPRCGCPPDPVVALLARPRKTTKP